MFFLTLKSWNVLPQEVFNSETILCRSAFGRDFGFESSWVCLYRLCTSGFGDFLPFFLADLLKLCQLDGECHWTAIFKSFHRFSMGFKSELWLGHSRTFTFLFWTHSSVALAVCLGSLSSCDVNLLHSLMSFVLWSRFSSRICLHLAAFIVPSILASLPVHAAEKHPHSMMLPPPCFMVRMVLDGWWAVIGFRQT